MKDVLFFRIVELHKVGWWIQSYGKVQAVVAQERYYLVLADGYGREIMIKISVLTLCVRPETVDSVSTRLTPRYV